MKFFNFHSHLYMLTDIHKDMHTCLLERHFMKIPLNPRIMNMLLALSRAPDSLLCGVCRALIVKKREIHGKLLYSQSSPYIFLEPSRECRKRLFAAEISFFQLCHRWERCDTNPDEINSRQKKDRGFRFSHKLSFRIHQPACITRSLSESLARSSSIVIMPMEENRINIS